jgi:hypothetical protein
LEAKWRDGAQHEEDIIPERSQRNYWEFISQCCGSGSSRIRNFLQDPDPESDPRTIISDPDPGSPDPDKNETELLKKIYNIST